MCAGFRSRGRSSHLKVNRHRYHESALSSGLQKDDEVVGNNDEMRREFQGEDWFRGVFGGDNEGDSTDNGDSDEDVHPGRSPWYASTTEVEYQTKREDSGSHEQCAGEIDAFDSIPVRLSLIAGCLACRKLEGYRHL